MTDDPARRAFATDAQKLRLVADWFDVEQDAGRPDWDNDSPNAREVQADLRRIANDLDAARAEAEHLRAENQALRDEVRSLRAETDK